MTARPCTCGRRPRRTCGADLDAAARRAAVPAEGLSLLTLRGTEGARTFAGLPTSSCDSAPAVSILATANLEAALREPRWISQAVVYGDRRPYLVALLTLDEDEAPALAAELGIDPDLTALASDPRVHDFLAREVDEINERFARIEQIKRFGVLDHDLTQAGGEMTPTLKVRRPVVYERYAARFAALYD